MRRKGVACATCATTESWSIAERSYPRRSTRKRNRLGRRAGTPRGPRGHCRASGCGRALTRRSFAQKQAQHAIRWSGRLQGPSPRLLHGSRPGARRGSVASPRRQLHPGHPDPEAGSPAKRGPADRPRRGARRPGERLGTEGPEGESHAVAALPRHAILDEPGGCCGRTSMQFPKPGPFCRLSSSLYLRLRSPALRPPNAPS